MDLKALAAWSQLAQVLIPAGIATVHQVVAAIRAAHGNVMTEAELNALCDAVINDATSRMARAHADAQDDGA